MNRPQVTLGFVIPWYGDDIGGGAESECRDVVKLLYTEGYDVEVLTTCVRDFRSDWGTNYHPAGVSVEGGIRVRRFPVSARDGQIFDELNRRLLQGELISAEEEEIFFNEMINSPALYDYIKQQCKQYLYFFIPYMFGTTCRGSMICPERSVLIPCLHDESYAYLGPIREMFRGVQDIAFLSPEEEALARRLYGLPTDVGKLIGGPVDCSWSPNPSRFRDKYELSRFLLYAGRTDVGKNADLLVTYFQKYVTEHSTDLKLIFIGGGGPIIPASLSDRVRLLGYLEPQDKYDCFGASLALCVPSIMESFSIVMMESWLAGRPVIVNANCAVTTDLCRRSNGGLYFDGYEEFREIVNYLSDSPSTALVLGQQGGAYVRANYSSETIAERYTTFIHQLIDNAFTRAS
jgi:glycosyltransferase involved in cell wall biosynthesis